MEEKKRDNKKIWVIATIILVLLVAYFAIFTSVFNAPLSSEEACERSIITTYDLGSYDKQFLDLVSEPEEAPGNAHALYTVIESYSQLKNISATLDSEAPTYAEKLKEVFENSEYNKSFFMKHSLLVLEMRYCLGYGKVADVETKGGDINVLFYKADKPGDGCYSVANGDSSIFIIPVLKKSLWTADITVIKRNTNWVAKPVIYLYPEEETNVNVQLGYEDKITVSYPKYVDGWNVLAKPDGKLVYNETGRKLYSLYYESESVIEFKVEKDGFVVKKEDTVEFLEEKLAILGLNEYEAEEFIIYWLPVLQAKEYNYIRFATADEIERNMPLEISPNPDTVIRVIMAFKGLDSPIEVAEQELTTPTREGFVAVEWGGTEIN